MSPSALASPVSPRSAIAFSSACFGMGRSEPQVHFKRNPRFLDCSESAADHEPMVESNQHDGDRLRQLMARAGVTQAKVAEAMGVSPTAVGSKWLTQGAIARHHIANRRRAPNRLRQSRGEALDPLLPPPRLRKQLNRSLVRSKAVTLTPWSLMPVAYLTVGSPRSTGQCHR